MFSILIHDFFNNFRQNNEIGRLNIEIEKLQEMCKQYSSIASRSEDFHSRSKIVKPLRGGNAPDINSLSQANTLQSAIKSGKIEHLSPKNVSSPTSIESIYNQSPYKSAAAPSPPSSVITTKRRVAVIAAPKE